MCLTNEFLPYIEKSARILPNERNRYGLSLRYLQRPVGRPLAHPPSVRHQARHAHQLCRGGRPNHLPACHARIHPQLSRNVQTEARREVRRGGTSGGTPRRTRQRKRQVKTTVLDASALLALFFDEPGAEKVEHLLHQAAEADEPLL